MSRRTIIIIVVIVVLAGVGYYAYSNYAATQAEPVAETDVLADLQSTIWASGKIVPGRWASLSPQVGGQIVDLSVEEGDLVQAGDALLRLDDVDLQANVRAAEAALETARAELARLQVGPRETELMVAEDNVRAAEAALLNALTQVSQAEAGITNALAQVSAAEAEKQRLRVGPTSALKQEALAQLRLAQNALEVTQSEYDKISWAGEVSLTPQAQALQAATLDYQVAQATYNTLLQGATDEDIAVADAAIESATAGVSQAEANLLSAQAAVAQAEVAVETAKHQRDLVAEGAVRAEDIAVAEAAVQQAETALQTAQESLEKTIVRAPFDSTIGIVDVRLGEQVVPGQPLLSLADLDDLQVETTDLRETDVGRLAVGMPVDLTFDALPDTLLTGTIVRISPQATAGQGGTNYTTLIDFDDEELPPALRWGMTAFVNIAVDE